MEYKLSDFDYYLPKDLIAKAPMKPRDHSRLLLLDRESGVIKHKHFYDLPDYLRAGDVLVLNNSKVFPARLQGRKKQSNGKLEVFLHRHLSGRVWQCLLGGRGGRADLEIIFSRGLAAKIIKNNNDGTWDLEFDKDFPDLMRIAEKIGEVPLPPYIKRARANAGKIIEETDKDDYQTIYANKNKIGSVAAPTAGLHFTKELLNKIKKKGVSIQYITLHVGLGTFAPVKTADIREHKMHAEYVEIKKDVLNAVINARQESGRVIAVGTTSVRSLEAVIPKLNKQKQAQKDFQGWVNIFIYPGYKFRAVDGMITNFHLPKSTLLMLVAAFAGKNNIDKAYKEAIKKQYRFYSYGDAMLIFD